MPDKVLSGSIFREALAAFAAASVILNSGTVIGWSSPAIPSMKQDALFETQFTDVVYSWIGSCVGLGFLLSSLLTPIIHHSLGPKLTVLLCCLPCFTMSSLLLLVASFYPSAWIFYFSRILGGFAFITANTTVPSYIIDITSPGHRGLAIMVNLFYRVGLMLVYCVGSVVSWWWTSLFNLCLVIPIFFLFLLMPDSPTSLAARGKHKEAIEAIQWLKQSRNVSLHKEDSGISGENQGNVLSKLQVISSLKLPENYRPTILSFCLSSAYFVSGVGPFLLFTVQFFQDAGTAINASISSIIVAAVNLLTVLIVSVGFSNPPRRVMILIGQAGIVVCLFSMAVFFHFKDLNQVENVEWLPLLILGSFFVFFNIGLSSFMWTIIAEILPTSIQSFVYPASMFIGSIFFFLSSFFFQSLFDALGGFGTFIVFAIPSLLFLIVFIFFLPETKGKTKKDSEDFFLRK